MSIEINLINKTALVTGGTRGIGKCIAEKLAETGAKVYATGTNLNQIKKLNNDKKNSSIHYLHLDLSKSENLKEFIAKNSLLLDIDILVNNAGINIVDFAEKINDLDFKKIQEINSYGPFILAQAFGKKMIKKKWGRIINISSIWSVASRPGRLSYSTSKIALLGITKTLAIEWAKHNVLVNSISPGFTLTELTKSTNSDEELNIIKKKIPLNRLAMPEEIANIVAFLSTDLSSYILGQNIIIDGGYTTI